MCNWVVKAKITLSRGRQVKKTANRYANRMAETMTTAEEHKQLSEMEATANQGQPISDRQSNRRRFRPQLSSLSSH